MLFAFDLLPVVEPTAKTTAIALGVRKHPASQETQLGIEMGFGGGLGLGLVLVLWLGCDCFGEDRVSVGARRDRDALGVGWGWCWVGVRCGRGCGWRVGLDGSILNKKRFL